MRVTNLVLVGAHANLITAAMFLTGMAANALVSKAAEKHLDVEFGWLDWALAGSVPGLAGLILLPLFLRWLAKPELVDTRKAQALARDGLADLGPWSVPQKVMASVFLLLIGLWSTSSLHGMGSALVALIGVCVLFLSRTYEWKDAVRESGAWDTLAWLGGLLSMAEALRSHGVIDWFRDAMQANVTGMPGVAIAIVLALIYFYSMYGFSMLTGHITALAAAFFSVAASAGAPAMLVVPLIAAFSNLCGCVTNYSTGARDHLLRSRLCARRALVPDRLPRLPVPSGHLAGTWACLVEGPGLVVMRASSARESPRIRIPLSPYPSAGEISRDWAHG